MSSDVRAHPNLLPNVRVRQRPKARHWNQIVEHLNRQNTGVDSVIQLPNHFDNRVNFITHRFLVKNIQGDYLVCVRWDGVTEGVESVSIARPMLLRTSTLSHNGVTFVYTDNVTRTASKTGETDETQVIIPAYVIGDQIFGTKNVFGGTGVVSVNGDPIVWNDMNMDARAWAKQA